MTSKDGVKSVQISFFGRELVGSVILEDKKRRDGMRHEKNLRLVDEKDRRESINKTVLLSEE